MDESAEARERWERLHEEAERIAVPRFDWVMVPVEAVFEGFADLVTHHHRRRPETPRD